MRFPIAVDKYVKSLTAKQQEVFQSKARFKAIHAGRRSGKTHVGRVMAVFYASRNPGVFIPIFERSTTCAAHRVMWRELRRDNTTWKLGLKFNESTHIVTCPNGSKIGLIGCDKLDETEKARGDSHPFVLVDEAGSFRPLVLQTLYRDVIRPSLVDMLGSLMLVGTPNESCLGPFRDACQSDKSAFKVWCWDMRDNPYIKNAEEEMAAVLAENGWTWDHPSFQREWLGQWVFDASSQVYDFEMPRNIAEPPKGLDCFVIGLDLGWNDDTALVVWGFNRYKGNQIWCCEAYKRPELDVTDIGELLLKYVQRYDPISIVGDGGGLGKTILKELSQRHGLSVKPAEKQNKAGYIKVMNAGLRKREIMIAPQLTEYHEEMRKVRWEPFNFRTETRRIAEGFADHLCDAGLYGYREAIYWFAEGKPKPIPPIGTTEYEDYLEEQQEAVYSAVHQVDHRTDQTDEFGHGPKQVWDHEEPDPFGDTPI